MKIVLQILPANPYIELPIDLTDEEKAWLKERYELVKPLLEMKESQRLGQPFQPIPDIKERTEKIIELGSKINDSLKRHLPPSAQLANYAYETDDLYKLDNVEGVAITDLKDWLQHRQPKGFKPIPIYSARGDQLRIYFENEEGFAENLNDDVILIRAFKDRRIVGVKINNILGFIKQGY
jgi:hypothetical protein